MLESPKKPKKYGNQVHLRLGDALVTAIEERAKQENITVTALMTKAAKQYLGWEDSSSQPIFNIHEVEERLFQRLSEQWISHTAALEEKLHKSVSECVSKFDLSKIENRVSERVLERLSQQQQDESVSQDVPKMIHIQNEEILDTDLGNETASSTKVTEQQDNNVSSPNTEIHSSQEPNQNNTSKLEEHTIETTPIGIPLLFESIGEGQVTKPSEAVRYLNEIEQNSTWDLTKLRNLKNKQLTYLKKPIDKRRDEPPLPITIKEYMFDWIPSEAFKNLNNTSSTGKLWWIQRLPENPKDREELINSRRKEWKLHHHE